MKAIAITEEKYDLVKEQVLDKEGKQVLDKQGQPVMSYPTLDKWPKIAPLDPWAKLIEARVFLLDNQEYLAHGVCSLHHPIITTSIPTAAVGVAKEGGEINFYFNPNFIDIHTVEEIAFIMSHEAFHVLNGHCIKKEYPVLWNICADVVINTWLLERGNFKLRDCFKDGMWDANKLDLNPQTIIDHVTAEDLYDTLLPDMQAKKKEIMDMIEEYMKSAMSGDVKEEMQGEGQGKGQGNGKGNQEMDGDGESSAGSTKDDHKGWDAVSQAAMEEVARDLKSNGTLDKSNAVGKTPAGVLRHFQDIDQDFSWEKYLQRFMASVVKRKESWERPIRRLVASKFGPRDIDYPMIPASVVEYDYTILVYADMSGSIGQEEVNRFRAILMRKPSEVKIEAFSFDTRIYEWKNWETDMPKGGGGTAFQEVVDHAQMHKGRVDGIVVLTDGYDSEPIVKQPRKWLWVSTSALLTDKSGFWVNMPPAGNKISKGRRMLAGRK